MDLSQNYFSSSIGKKQLMAVTGLGLIGFVVAHLLGNFTIFIGADVFNFYGHTLTSNKLIYVAEAGLIALFLTHMALAFTLKLQNSAARPVKYYVKRKTGFGETFASQTMPYTGMILGLFVVLHLLNFKFGSNYMTTVDGVEMRDLHRTVVEYFANGLYTTWYVFAMVVLGIHTSHGFHSAFQSIGWVKKKYIPTMKLASQLYGVFVTVGFSSVAIFCHFQN